MITEQQQTDSNAADKKSFNIRVPQAVVLRIEEQARVLGTTPTTLIQAIVVRHFENDRAGRIDSAADSALLGKLDAIGKDCELIQQTEAARYGQLLFEIVKTRSALFHSLDQTLGAEGVESIMDACEEAARQYIARLSTEPEQGR